MTFVEIFKNISFIVGVGLGGLLFLILAALGVGYIGDLSAHLIKKLDFIGFVLSLFLFMLYITAIISCAGWIIIRLPF